MRLPLVFTTLLRTIKWPLHSSKRLASFSFFFCPSGPYSQVYHSESAYARSTFALQVSYWGLAQSHRSIVSWRFTRIWGSFKSGQTFGNITEKHFSLIGSPIALDSVVQTDNSKCLLDSLLKSLRACRKARIESSLIQSKYHLVNSRKNSAFAIRNRLTFLKFFNNAPFAKTNDKIF